MHGRDDGDALAPRHTRVDHVRPVSVSMDDIGADVSEHVGDGGALAQVAPARHREGAGGNASLRERREERLRSFLAHRDCQHMHVVSQTA